MKNTLSISNIKSDIFTTVDMLPSRLFLGLSLSAAIAMSTAQTSNAALMQLRFTGTIDSITERVDQFGDGSFISSNSISSWGDFSTSGGYTIDLTYDTSVAGSGSSTQSSFSNAITAFTFSLDTGYSSAVAVPIATQIFQRNASIDNFNVYGAILANHNGEINSEAPGNKDIIQLRDDQATKVADASVLLGDVAPFSDWEDARTFMGFGKVTEVMDFGGGMTFNNDLDKLRFSMLVKS